MAILGGELVAGLSYAQLHHLATAHDVRKVSRRDLPIVLAQRGAGILSRIQSGNLHRYLMFVLAGGAAALLWSVTRG